MKTRFGMIILALALVAPLPAFAHEGHEHKLMGTIKAVDATHLVLVTTDTKTHQEKTVNVAFNAKTKFRRGDDTLDRGALKPGERAVVSVGNGKEPLSATEVRIGAAK
jgi:hypothetical protein